ncbi:MAG: hypothetical protein KC503_45370 [Myxococcales bacterium]|nr:hypothetical protein [Myxococcales bacterium]
MKRFALVLASAGLLLFVGSTPASAQSDTQPQPPPSDQPAPPSGPGASNNRQPPPPTPPAAAPNNTAQPPPPGAHAPHPPRHRGVPMFRTDEQRDDYLMATNPYYRDAYSGRRSGIMMAIIGGALGLASIASGSFGVLYSCTIEALDFNSNRDTCVKTWHHVTIWGGVGLLAVSLAVGITTAASNNRRLNAIRSQFPVIEAGIMPGGGNMRLTWRF